MRRRPRAIGEFCWIDADVGVECRVCGLVTVYCDWEAAERFRERGWPTGVEDAVKRFRCVCGSRDVELWSILISKRPKPVPIRPAALRPIYREQRRTLNRRGPAELPDPAAIEAALDVLRAAIADRKERDPRGADLDAAIMLLRPHCYRQEDLDCFPDAVAPGGHPLFGGSDAGQRLVGILRQLGRPRD